MKTDAQRLRDIRLTISRMGYAIGELAAVTSGHEWTPEDLDMLGRGLVRAKELDRLIRQRLALVHGREGLT